MSPIAVDVRRRALAKKHNRFLRREGITPANLYGAGIESVALQVDTKALMTTLGETTRNTPIEIKILGEDKARAAFIWEVQRHPLTDEILHVDFYHVDATRQMHASVPIVLLNIVPELDKFEMQVSQFIREIEVETLPADLPTKFEVDVAHLKELGDHVLVKEVKVPERVKVLTPLDLVVTAVQRIIEKIEEEPVAAAAAAPA
ncbi:MAG: 50S ribosomal protein L25, partial [Chloroflexi bacterium]|nr:50S ribosomal protein L25 [Chloroflexota bacterium]